MKNIFFAVLAFVTVMRACPLAVAADNPETEIIAYYFHGKFRCHTCNMIEKYAKEAIESYFRDEIASGKVEFRQVNIQAKGNEHYMKTYQLYAQALVLSLVKDGKEIKSKNLTRIWELARNQKRFSEYVVNEIDALRKELP